MQNKLKSLILSLLFINLSVQAEPPKNFSSAKRIAGNIFSSVPYTLYCHCPYDKYKRINLKACGMSQAKVKKRAKRLEWEHMMPVSTYIKHYRCGREKLCSKKNGKRYGGRKCCEKIDKTFKQAESELYNLWPSVGLVNGSRRDYHYAMIGGNQSFYGCVFKLDKHLRRVEPDDRAKGIVARASLFMSQKYSIKLSKAQRRMFEIWDNKNPPSQYELKWAKKVAEIEGYQNPFITRHKG